MIKCKNGDATCPKGKATCCCECEEIKSCEAACNNNSAECEDAIYEGTTELEVFENKYIASMKAIAQVSQQKKDLEEKEKKMKADLLEAMEKYSIKSVDNDVVKITYVSASNGRKIDSATLKKEMPQVYEKYSTPTFKDAYLTIKVK